MATSQQTEVKYTVDNTEDTTITIALQECEIDDTNQVSSQSTSGSGSLKEKPPETRLGLSPSDPLEIVVELNGANPLDIVLEDSSDWDTDDDGSYDSDLENDIYLHLKITLKHIHPPIWRCIEVSCKDTFEDLHYYIQKSMGWRSCHSHSFIIENLRLVSEFAFDIYKEMGSTNDVLKENYITLRDIFTIIGDKIVYEYDHGKSWEHEIAFEKFVLTAGNCDGMFPRCVGGQRACPPEDCGGPEGYLHLLEVRNNPQHEDYEALIKKNGLEEAYPAFDPETFDKTAVFQKL